MGGRRSGGDKGDEISGLHSGKEWKSRETHTGKDKKRGGGDEKNVAHWRKAVKEDFERRIKMFVALVKSVAMNGAEIWSWNNEGRLDIIKRRYMKWILELDKVTPNYILREETREEEIRTKAIRRTLHYEEGARSSDQKLVRE